MTPQRYTLYIDQIIINGNKQDTNTVVALLKCTLMQLSDDLPFITEVILQSDNAHCYQNSSLLVAIAVLNDKFKNKIFVSQFIHSKTQDGKTILDAHFATAMRHLATFMTS